MSAAEQDSERQADDRLLHRLLFFSDAVFAIVLTLLVLELRPPETHDASSLASALGDMSDHFFAFGMSFALVAVFWAAHMTILRRLALFDWPTAWANLLFLAPVCLTPFASSLLGRGAFGPAAWIVYSCVLIATSAAMLILWLTASRGGGRLLGGISGRERAYRGLRAASPGLAFGAGLVVLHMGYLRLAQNCWVLIPTVYLLAALLLKPKPPKASAAASDAD